MSQPFFIDKTAIFSNPRVHLLDDILPINETLENIEWFINSNFTRFGETVVQHGRVIAIRPTDKDRLASAFKAAIYLGKFNDMDNRDRFFNMVKAGHSYEPIRGESVIFLFIGVGKPVYDHLVTYSVGRYGRIAAGQRANLPWGYEVPVEARNTEAYTQNAIQMIRDVITRVKGMDENIQKEQMQAARSMLPVGYIMPPFLYEFGEEALVHIFQQRLWEPGAQGATKEIVNDMWECMLKIDRTKWEMLYDYHGPHIQQWLKVMRTLRDMPTSIGQALSMLEQRGIIPVSDEHNLNHMNLYDILMTLFGNPRKSMWDKGGTSNEVH
jgi:hypothetical protein